MKVLITGANGLLGQKLVALLLENGEQVIATDRFDNKLEYLGDTIDFQKLDITDTDAVDKVIAETKPDVIVNCAAMTLVDKCETEREACHRINVEGVRNLVKSCESHSVFLVQLSTDFIFDGLAGPYDETAKANPLNYYGQTKLEAEKILMKSTLKWAIVRTVLVYGIAPTLERSNIILWVKENLENGKPLKIVDDQWRTPTLAEDLALGCYLVSKHSATGVYNISGKDLLTPYEMAISTCEYFGLDASLITKADASTFTQAAKRPARTGFILDKAQNNLGYQATSFKEGIAILSDQLNQVK